MQSCFFHPVLFKLLCFYLFDRSFINRTQLQEGKRIYCEHNRFVKCATIYIYIFNLSITEDSKPED